MNASRFTVNQSINQLIFICYEQLTDKVSSRQECRPTLVSNTTESSETDSHSETNSTVLWSVNTSTEQNSDVDCQRVQLNCDNTTYVYCPRVPADDACCCWCCCCWWWWWTVSM